MQKIRLFINERGWFIVACIVAVAAMGGAYIYLPNSMSVSYSSGAAAVEALKQNVPTSTKPLAHIKTPESVKSIYMSQCVVGTKTFRNSLVELVDTTELNSIIIDIRDFTGMISFPTDNPILKDSVSDACGATDMKQFIDSLHAKNIYVIGRITVFQNPHYSKLHPEEAVQKKGGGVWKDYKGLAFVDVGSRPYWDTVVELSKVSYALGFDELNYDYVRFPSDGPMSQAVYTHSIGKSKGQALEEFFIYLSENVRPTGAVLSADLFGMAATNYDDMGIGQVLERALPYFDYVSPMVYPSHYPSGFNGYKNVNQHSYDIVKLAMDTAAKRAEATTTTVAAIAHTRLATSSPQLYGKQSYSRSKIRPWLQSFNYPVVYTPAMVGAQIQATYDAGLTSYFFWDAANKYSALRQTLSKPASSTPQ